MFYQLPLPQSTPALLLVEAILIDACPIFFSKNKDFKLLPAEILLDPKELFEDFSGYRYSCFVTNLDLPFDQVWNVYNTRADCENRIKELKNDFGLENFCLEDFWATEVSFSVIMMAYNLMSLFHHFALNHHDRATLKTLKSYCFVLGAWTVNHANKKVLKISLPSKRRIWMEGIFSQINNLSPPFQYSNE